MTRKQLNIGLAPEDFARVQEVARRQGVTVTALCRGAILDALDAKRDLVAALTSVVNKLGYKVPSQSGRGSYVVNLDGEPFCTCPDFEKHQQPCKHIYAVEFIIQREDKARWRHHCGRPIARTGAAQAGPGRLQWGHRLSAMETFGERSG